jgi:ubiquinone/menaquinone biosynthesis C-methylase UbiE
MSIRSYFMARFYDASMRKMEDACLSVWRSDLLSEAHGDVLEIGSGTGVNLSYYPKSINSLVLTEPEPHMLHLLRSKISEGYGGKYRAEGLAANRLEFPDNSFDSVVSTLVLCSVDSPAAALGEIKRVLKPGGKLYFIEHVIANETPRLIKWQKFFQPFWICMCGNCHLTRDTETNITHAGFTFHKIERINSSGGPPIVSPTIKGIAIST